MATIAFAALGAGLGGTGLPIMIAGSEFLLGQAIGATVGSIIDANYLMPALFPQDELKPETLDSLQITGSQEGATTWRITGDSTRVSGTWIYLSDLFKIEDSIGGGKGGGGAPKTTTYDYYIHAVCHFGFAHIVRYRKVFMDMKLVYQDPEEAPLSITSNEISSVLVGQEFKIRILRSAGTTVDLTDVFKIGLDIQVSGFAEPLLNGTFRVLNAVTYSDGTSELEIFDNGYEFGELAGQTITITQAASGWLPWVVNNAYMYTGSSAQTPDSFLESIFGVGKVPAFHNQLYIVFDTLMLERFGNRAPNIEAITKNGSNVKISDTIEDIMSWSGITNYSVSDAMFTTSSYGFKYLGLMTATDMLTPIILSHNLMVRETDGELQFLLREESDVVEIPATDYPATEVGEPAKARPFKQSVMDEDMLPRSVQVRFSNLEANYQNGSRRFIVEEATGSEDLQIDLSMVSLDSITAKSLATRLVYSALVNSLKFDSLFLPAYYFTLQEGDLLRVTHLGETRDFMAQSLDFGANGLIEIKGFLEESQFFGITLLGGTSTPPATKPPSVGVTFGQVYPCRPLQFGVTQDPFNTLWKAYYAFGPQGTEYIGGSIWEDNGSGYTLLAKNEVPGTVGYAKSVLGEPVDPLFWDYVSTVDVYLYHGTLSSASENEVAGRERNIAIIGNPPYHEVIGFVDAELIDTNTYRLSQLLRGLRGTEGAMDDHKINEDFALVSGLQVMDVGSSTSERSYKILGTGDELADADEIKFTTAEKFNYGVLSNGYAAAMPVTDLQISRDSSNNIRITWQYRHISLFRVLFEEPNFPSGGSAQVRLMFPGPVIFTTIGTMLTKSINNQTEIIFTAAEISAAGSNPALQQNFLISATSVLQTDNISQPGFYYDASLSTFVSISV